MDADFWGLATAAPRGVDRKMDAGGMAAGPEGTEETPPRLGGTGLGAWVARGRGGWGRRAR